MADGRRDTEKSSAAEDRRAVEKLPAQTPDGRATFLRFWAIGLVVLMLATFPLWNPMTRVRSAYPAVNWIELSASPQVMAAVECGLEFVLLAALVMAFRRPDRRGAWWTIAGMLWVLIAIDQHRLQPWVYQSLVYCVIAGGMRWQEGRRWITVFAASIYMFSAAGKLDYQFAHTVGSQMVQTLTQPFGGLESFGLDAVAAARIAMALPAGEFLIGILILYPPTRRIGGTLAIAMHLALIGILGPWALGHSPGVLTWNALLAIQSGLLFVRREPAGSDPEPDPTFGSRPAQWALRALVSAVLVLPLTERAGYWDHWTSWALYSPHSSRAEIEIHASAVGRLSDETQSFLARDSDGDGWSELQIGRWSLDRRWVPVYPQGRYQLAVADALASGADLENAIRVKLKSVSNRWNGTRDETFLIGADEISRAMERYWLRSPDRR